MAARHDRVLCDEWVWRVLGFRAASPQAANAPTAQVDATAAVQRTEAVPHSEPVLVMQPDLRALAELWRQATTAAADDVAGFCQGFLAADDVQADPRFARARQVVAGLPLLLEPFGDALARQLEAAATKGGDIAAARQTVASLRRSLEQAKHLAWLQDFAAKATGRACAAHGRLGEALGKVEQGLA
jgi:hypothetical protein